MELGLLQDLVIAVGLGLLVGLQREWQSERPAGIRTFTLITLLGSLCAFAAPPGSLWLPAAGLLAVAAMLWLGNRLKRGDDDAEHHGITTEVAALIMFLVGVILMHGHTEAAIVVTGVTAALLHWKDPMHAFARRIGADEFRAIIQFVLIALVLLPILPNQAYGPYAVLNPFKIWLMVTLIVGMNLVSYVIYRAMTARKGAWVGGLLGGMISSTATTVSHARQSRSLKVPPQAFSVVIVVASAVVNIRILLEIAVIGPGLLRYAVPPFLLLGLFMTVCGIVLIRRGSEEGEAAETEHRNPAEVKTAIMFGALFAVVLLAVAFVNARFGLDAVYVVALVSGLTDVDAMTLSVADLFHSGRMSADDAWRVVLVASLANLMFKAGITAAFGTRRVFRDVAMVFGMTALLGIAMVFWWPDIALPAL
ncbi:MAG: MgtC/SapB family protein [Gammaproteobacteria bacterium]|nr:MgtC/SapB family protein [Gammaproteobacteria bacterium]